MLKNDDLRMVKIGCFTGHSSFGGYTTGEQTGEPMTVMHMELDEKSIKYITCIIDDSTGTAIDIFSGECYHIIQKDKFGRIIDSKENIQNGVYYALTVEKDKVKTESQLYNIYLNYMASKTAKVYQKKMENNGSYKTFKKEKK